MDNESKLPRYVYPDTLSAQEQMLKSHPQLMEMRMDREDLFKGRYMPRFHYFAPFLPSDINDPNGLCKWSGVYHLFYQQMPPMDHRQHWGHVVSDDLVIWKDLPTAIFPGPEEKVYSGNALVEDDRVYAMYHGVKLGNMIAQSSDPLLLTWDKRTDGAVIPAVPHDDQGKPYRVFDPFLWKEGDTYYALSGTFKNAPVKQLYGKHHMAIYIFESENLDTWTFLGEFMPKNPFYGGGEDGACPYFFPFGNKHILLHFSHTSNAHCLIGKYNSVTHTFLPEQHYPLSNGEVNGGGLHAPCAMADGNGGCYAIFNVKDGYPKLNRQGTMSIVRHLSMGEDGLLRQTPIEGIEKLRIGERSYAADMITPTSPFRMLDMGDCYELELELDMGSARGFKVSVLCDEKKREHTDITVTYRPEDDTPRRSYPYIQKGQARVYLTVDSTQASLLPDLWPRAAETLDCVLPLDEKIHLRIFVDICMVEIFLNDRLALTQMVYPSLETSVHGEVQATGGDATLDKAIVYQMRGSV